MGVRFVGVCIAEATASSLEVVLLLEGVCAPAGFAVGNLDVDLVATVDGFCGVLSTGSGSSRTEGSSSSCSCSCSCSDCAVSQLSFDPALTVLSGVGAGCRYQVSLCLFTSDENKVHEGIPSGASLSVAPWCIVATTRCESCQCRTMADLGSSGWVEEVIWRGCKAANRCKQSQCTTGPARRKPVRHWTVFLHRTR